MSATSLISDRSRELTRKNSGFRHTHAVGLNVAAHDENFTTFLLLELFFHFCSHLHNVNSEKEESCQGKRLSE